ncbi:hypothetical protein GWK47_029513 [Chionoecetes opilio]|uniref:Uncharacterized protein n=1 Tax=Chionoecetes opilio TaxID=41210 RepID=A0A8J4YKB7_CHIOP|nr:hypothetical protein GWK47_029513 [Chionoecetes opilio]
MAAATAAVHAQPQSVASSEPEPNPLRGKQLPKNGQCYGASSIRPCGGKGKRAASFVTAEVRWLWEKAGFPHAEEDPGCGRCVEERRIFLTGLMTFFDTGSPENPPLPFYHGGRGSAVPGASAPGWTPFHHEGVTKPFGRQKRGVWRRRQKRVARTPIMSRLSPRVGPHKDPDRTAVLFSTVPTAPTPLPLADPAAPPRSAREKMAKGNKAE